jgi:hypothetical protein
MLQHLEAIAPTPSLVRAGEVLSDIAEAGCPEQGVDDRMDEDITVRVAGEAGLVLEGNAPEDESPSRLERMDVIADPDPAHPLPSFT